MVNHFLTGNEMEPEEIRTLIDFADDLKKERERGELRQDLRGKTLVLLFEKPSLRTHISFSIGMQELGGSVVESFSFNRKKEEPADVGQVLAGYCHAIALRTHEHSILEKMADKTSVPVINGLSDSHHPCQILADILTIKQRFGKTQGVSLAYVGDGNNILHSLLLLAPIFGIDVTYACPVGFEPDSLILKRASASATGFGTRIKSSDTAVDAVKNATAVYTDVWTSMGFEAEENVREVCFRDYQVNAPLFAHANSDAVVMHCLPMVRGKEISPEMADHPNSVLFQQSANRLHVQKALLLKLMVGMIHA
jgi:ornithine carbamoyltransferase